MGNSPLISILDLARWAPSGDNTQPWRFEIVSDNHVVVHGFDTRDHCVYDPDGHTSQMAVGALLETLRNAATIYAFHMKWTRRKDTPTTHLMFDVVLEASSSLERDPLAAYIEQRTVQRRAMRIRCLTSSEKQMLDSSLGSGYRILWIEGWRQRIAVASLLFDNAKIRLTMPEAFEVHRSVIDWNRKFSHDKIPEQAVGAGFLTARLMRWVMRDWRRVEFFNKYLGGTILPRIQLDLIPSLACAAHFLIVAKSAVGTIDDHVAAGGVLQRFWLTATSLGLQLQPEMTPLIFSRYVHEGRRFSKTPGLWEAAESIANRMKSLFGTDAITHGVFLGRIGAGKTPRSRSLRRPLSELTYDQKSFQE